MVTAAIQAELRARGAYFTPEDATDFLAHWAIRDAEDVVLEPSFGDGAFVRAARARFSELGAINPSIWAVELDEATASTALDGGWVNEETTIINDFLKVEARPVTAVIGNPPFVRIRHLPDEQQASALAAARRSLAGGMEPSGSLWMPIVLHAVNFIRLGGRMAWVLPYEATHVRYAKPLWSHLADHFGSIEVIRVRERLFPEILQDVVLLTADHHGSRTNEVTFTWFETREDLTLVRPAGAAKIRVDAIAADERPFERAISGERGHRVPVAPLRDLLRIRIGYIAGDKKFFHPDESAIDRFGLDTSSLTAAISSGRQFRGAGVLSSEVGTPSRLFAPAESLLPADHRYIKHGETQGVDQRYKCRVRSPWYRVPVDVAPDLIFSVFGDAPRLMINDAKYLVSNSLIAANVVADSAPEEVVAGWYTSLARLSLLHNVHALGGGMLIMIPGEVGRIEVPLARRTSHLAALGSLLAAGKVEEAYQLGDRAVLEGEFGMSPRETASLREAVNVAESWRRRADS